MATAVKASKSVKPVKVIKKSSKNATSHSYVQLPALLGLALLLGLLCILPWVSGQRGNDSFRALQISLALILALSGGVCLGLQIAANKSR